VDSLGARAVISVERPTRDIAIELCAIRRELLPETVEHLDRQAARVGGRLQHDRRNSADEDKLRNTVAAISRIVTRSCDG